MDYLDDVQSGLDLFKALPWLILFVFALPIVLLARWKKIYPAVSLLFVSLVPCIVSTSLLIWSDLYLVVAVVDLLVAAVAVSDLLSVPGPTTFEAARQATLIASLDKPHPITVVIRNLSGTDHEISLRDDAPDEFQQEPDSFQLLLRARSQASFDYQLKAFRRGAFQLQRVYVRARSRLGLWRRYLEYPVASRIHVYPDMQQLSEYAVLARTNRLSLMGVRRTRKIGQDNEFERLRDYSPDDNYKHIDWRATARRNKLTVKDFQMNQSQRLIFLMDCGRMMTNTVHGISLLDHAFNAMLMLGYVALRQGDSVGLLCFSDRIHIYVPPHGGMQQMNRLLHASFDRFPQLVESRYDEAFLYLSAHCKKRSLVVLITNVIDEVNANQVRQYLQSLTGQHLAVGVLLRDHALFRAADATNPQGRDLFRAAAAATILSWRQQLLSDLQHRGVLSVDAFPEDLTAPLINRYLEIKARHLL